MTARVESLMAEWIKSPGCPLKIIILNAISIFLLTTDYCF